MLGASDKGTQHDLIVEYCDRVGFITSMSAYERLGVTQLATRISELETAGYEFSRTKRRGANRRGKVVPFVEYRITVKPDLTLF